MLDAFRLDGRVALVTGARRGMGQAMAVAFSEMGADICAVDLEDSDDTSRKVQDHGRRCYSSIADLAGTTPDTATRLVNDCVANLGRLDILVNNAAINRRVRALEVAPQDWDAVIQVDLSAVFYLSQAAARHLIDEGKPGKVINMASMLSFQGGVGTPVYAAAKSGVLGLTRALANEWAGHGINVNAIAPGWISTEFTRALRENPVREPQITCRIPAGRWGTPDDVCGAAIFLASPASDYIHGTVIPVDGGWLAW